jgi:hypothetical protein
LPSADLALGRVPTVEAWARSEVESLIYTLKFNFHLECKAHLNKGKASQLSKVITLVSPYLHPSLSYKVGL